MGTELKRVCGQRWKENPGKFAEKGHARLFPLATELPPIVLWYSYHLPFGFSRQDFF